MEDRSNVVIMITNLIYRPSSVYMFDTTFNKYDNADHNSGK